MTAAPAWLEAHLIELGAMHPGRVTRRGQWRRCGRCRAPILAALDSDKDRLVAAVHVDPNPLDVHGELAALLTDRGTYRVHRAGPALELHARDQWAIAGTPPAPGHADVLAEHACGAPLSAHWLPSHTATRAPLPEHPPY